MSKGARSIVMAGILVLALIGALWMYIATSNKSKPFPPSEIFYGRVIDQDGHALQGVVVAGHLFRLGRSTLGVAVGSLAEDQTTSKKFREVTGESGEFRVIVPDGYERLMIEAVEKEGYIGCLTGRGRLDHHII